MEKEKYCRNCGKKVSGKFCDYCGTSMNDAANVSPQDSGMNRKSSGKKRGLLIILIVFLVFGGAIGIGLQRSENRNSDSDKKSINAANLDNTTDSPEKKKSPEDEKLPEDEKSPEKKKSSEDEEKSSEEEDDEIVAMGKTGSLGDLELIVNEIQETDRIQAANGMVSYKPDSGKFAIINVTITNTSKKSQSLLLNYFKLIGPDEAEYVPTMIVVGDDKFLSIDTINPNLDVSGNLAFEIPKKLKLKDCILRYSDFDLFSGYSKFKLK